MIRTVRTLFGLLAVCSAFLWLNTGRAQGHFTRTDSIPPPEISKSSFGLVLDGAWNIDRANFQTLPGVPNCCPLFTNGSGFGGSVGLSYDYDAFGDGHLGIRALVSFLDGYLSDVEQTVVSVGPGTAAQLPLQFTLDSKFIVAEFQPYYMLGLGNFGISVGPSIGFMLSSTFDQSETIEGNTGAFYPSESRTRNVFTNQAIPNASKTWLGAFAGVSYRLPMNSSGSLHLIPEIYYDYGFTPLVSGLTWTVSALRGGATIAYTPIHYFEPPPPPPPAPPPPPPPPPKPVLTASIQAYSVTNDVKDSNNLSVRVEEFYSTTTTPLLPFVLFGLDDAHIPSRYHSLTPEQANAFDIRNTDTTNNLTVYHDILNILGLRMRQNPKAKITLTGCTSNEPEELADPQLALSRAQSVASYLEHVWGISQGRITLEARGLPQKPSSLTQQEGKEENRRVEMTSNDPTILKQVFLADTDLTTDPPMMQFVPTVNAQAGVKFWDLYVTQAVMTLHHEFGKGTQPKGWDWDLRSVSAKIPRTEDTIEYGLQIVDSAGQEQTTTGTIPVRQVTISKKRQERIADKVIERYTLVLFDFGSSKIDPQNERAIEYIRQQITPGTKVHITGYADRTGEDTLNLHLTQDRANAVAKMLGATDYEAKGVGKSILLFDNNIPEGRFYSRTVNIELIKPVNQ